MTLRCPACLLALLLAAPAALAEDRAYVSDQGVAYLPVPGGPGAVLRSAEPQGYSIGIVGQPVSGIETIRLAPDCTAKSALVGAGRWFRDGAGFSAVFVEGASVTFPGQVPPEVAGAGCGARRGWVLYPPDPTKGTWTGIWLSGSGVPYDATRDDDGLALVGLEPQAYRPGHMGDAAPEVRGAETIRLRADCSAEGALLGEGSWIRVDGGTVVSWLAGDAITFGAVPPEDFGPGC